MDLKNGVTLNELMRWMVITDKEPAQMHLEVWGRDKEGNFGWVVVPVYTKLPDGTEKLVEES